MGRKSKNTEEPWFIATHNRWKITIGRCQSNTKDRTSEPSFAACCRSSKFRGYQLYAPRNAYLSFLVFCGAANTGEICIPNVMLNYVAEPAAKSVANISAHLKLGKVRQKSWQKLRQQLRQNVWQTFRRI